MASAVGKATGPSTNGIGPDTTGTASGNKGSLFDTVGTDNNGTANTANTSGVLGGKPNTDGSKVTAMKSDGISPLTALGPIIVILLVVGAVILWHVNHTAAIIIGLVGLVLLAMWLLGRRNKNRRARHNQRGTHRAHNQHGGPPHLNRQSFGDRWRSRRASRNLSGAHEPRSWRGGGYGNSSHGNRNPWWRRGRHNPLNHNRKNRGMRGPESNGHGQSRYGGQGRTDGHDRGRRGRFWNPFRRRHRHGGNSGHGPDGHGGSRGGHGGRRNNDSHGGGRYRPWRNGGHNDGNGHGGYGGTHGGRGHHSRPGRKPRRWYAPWRGRSNHGSSGNHYNGHSGSGGSGGGHGHGRRFDRTRRLFGRLWNYQHHDPDEPHANRNNSEWYDDPNRRSRYRDWWNIRRTRSQRENVDYAGFAVGEDGTANPRYSKWREWRNGARARNWYGFWPWGSNGRLRAEATRLYPDDGPSTPSSTAIGRNVTSLGPSTQQFTIDPVTSIPNTSSAVAVPVDKRGGAGMAHYETANGIYGEQHARGNNGSSAVQRYSGQAAPAATGRPAAASYVYGASGTQRSGIRHMGLAIRFRAWARALINANDGDMTPAAEQYLARAAYCDAVAENRAQLTAQQMGDAANESGR